jgi:S1-C subfamily serine protease
MGIGRANKEWLDTVSSDALGSILMGPPGPGSAAARAGLLAGDVILEADGQDIHANAELHAAFKKHQPGESVKLKVRRASGSVADITVIC